MKKVNTFYPYTLYFYEKSLKKNYPSSVQVSSTIFSLIKIALRLVSELTMCFIIEENCTLPMNSKTSAINFVALMLSLTSSELC